MGVSEPSTVQLGGVISGVSVNTGVTDKACVGVKVGLIEGNKAVVPDKVGDTVFEISIVGVHVIVIIAVSTAVVTKNTSMLG